MIHIKRFYWRLNAAIAYGMFLILHVLNYLFGNRNEPIIDEEVMDTIYKSWHKY